VTHPRPSWLVRRPILQGSSSATSTCRAARRSGRPCRIASRLHVPGPPRPVAPEDRAPPVELRAKTPGRNRRPGGRRRGKGGAPAAACPVVRPARKADAAQVPLASPRPALEVRAAASRRERAAAAARRTRPAAPCEVRLARGGGRRPGPSGGPAAGPMARGPGQTPLVARRATKHPGLDARRGSIDFAARRDHENARRGASARACDDFRGAAAAGRAAAAGPAAAARRERRGAPPASTRVDLRADEPSTPLERDASRASEAPRRPPSDPGPRRRLCLHAHEGHVASRAALRARRRPRGLDDAFARLRLGRRVAGPADANLGAAGRPPGRRPWARWPPAAGRPRLSSAAREGSIFSRLVLSARSIFSTRGNSN